MIELQDRRIIKELLLNIPYFLEWEHMLEEEQFEDIIDHVESRTVPVQGSQDILHDHFYVFLGSGIVVDKQKRLVVLKGRKAKKKKQISSEASPTMQRSIKSGEVIDQVDLHGSNLFVNNRQQTTGVFCLSKASLLWGTRLAISKCRTNKLKFLIECPLLAGADCRLLQSHINEFEFIKIKFEETLYSPRLRKQKMFLLLQGSVACGNGTSNSRVVSGRSILLSDSGQDTAKCVSYTLSCYTVDFNLIKQLSANKVLSRQERSKTIDACGSASHGAHCQASLLSTPRQMPTKEAFSSLANQWKSEAQLAKNTKIRQYFSNFTSQIYDIYSKRKTEGLKMDEDLRRQVLYEIKIPRPKAPDMATLNAKLKLARIHKMAKCKEMLLQSRYSRLSWSNEPESGLPDAPTDKPLPENTATRTLSHPIFRKPQLRSYCKFARLIRE